MEFDTSTGPDARGWFGEFGGRFAPETLMAPVEELEAAYRVARSDPAFQAELARLLKDFAGRPTPLFHAQRLTARLGGAKIYLKREDLLHTGAHKINNCLGQGLAGAANGENSPGGGDRGGAARCSDSHRGGVAGNGMRCVHGRGRHGAAGAQRLSYAAARNEGGIRFLRDEDAEGRN